MKMAKNTNEKFEALRDAILVRKAVTSVLRVLFLQSQKRAENLQIDLEHANTCEECNSLKEKIRVEKFNQRLIEQEFRTIAEASAKLTGSLREGNTIFPNKDASYCAAEIAERRVCMDRAVASCNVLLDELQFIAEEVYADKNKFTALALRIKALFDKIKRVRQADNRFLR